MTLAISLVPKVLQPMDSEIEAEIYSVDLCSSSHEFETIFYLVAFSKDGKVEYMRYENKQELVDLAIRNRFGGVLIEVKK